MELFETLFFALLFLLACFTVTLLLKKKFKAKTWLFLFSLLKTKKPIPWFDKLSKFKRFLDAVADFGFIAGFGSLGIDYRFGKKLPKGKRLTLFLVSFIFLYLLFDSVLSLTIAGSPLMEEWMLFLFSFSFALLGFCGFAIAALLAQGFDIISKMLVGEKALPGVAPIIPGIQIPNVPIFVPLHGWISILIILVVHEFAHGILARRFKLKIKSTGLLLFGFLPIGAFVEPDEKQLSKAQPLKQVRVFSAGSTANLILAAIVFLPFILMLSYFSTPLLLITSVSETTLFQNTVIPSPAFKVLEPGMQVLKVNSIPVLSAQQFVQEAGKSSTLALTVKTQSGEVLEKTLEKNAAGKLGIEVVEITALSGIPEFLIIFFDFLKWLFLLNFLIALVNFLPMIPFDGGRIAKIVFSSYLGFLNLPHKQTEMLVSRLFTWFILALLLINALPLFAF